MVYIVTAEWVLGSIPFAADTNFTQHTSLHRAARTNTLKLEYSEQQSDRRA